MPAIIPILMGLLIYLALGESGERLVRRRAESAWTRYGKYLTRSVEVGPVQARPVLSRAGHAIYRHTEVS